VEYDPTQGNRNPIENSFTVFKSFEDFFQLHLLLIQNFPEEAGLKQNCPRTLPELPPQQMLVTYATAKSRVENLNDYLNVKISFLSFLFLFFFEFLKNISNLFFFFFFFLHYFSHYLNLAQKLVTPHTSFPF